MKRILFVLPLMAVALLGIGCKKDTPPTQEVPNAVAPTPKAAAPAEQPLGVSLDVLYARQVLRNLSEAKSFRASMVLPSATGAINTNLDFNRASGLLGKVTLPTDIGAQTVELYSSGDEIWFRQGQAAWQNLSNTVEGKNFNQIFQNAFNYQNRYESTVADNAKLLGRDQDANANCTRYAFTQSSNNGSSQNFTLCVSGDMPVYLTIEGPYGQIEIKYRDVNGNVVVKRPV